MVKYVIDSFASDSVATMLASRDSNTFICGGDAGMLANGDTIDVVGKADGNVVFLNNGGLRAISDRDVLFCTTNPDGVEDLYSNPSYSGEHTAVGHFYGTLTPYIIIVALLLVSMMMGAVANKFRAAARFSVMGMMICLTAVAVLEFVGYYTVGNSMFWWCDATRYGFLGALWRIVPFVIMAVCQISTLPLCHMAIKRLYSDEDVKLSLLPMVISVGVITPILMYGNSLAVNVLGLGNDALITWITILVVCMIAGIVASGVINAKALGRKNGLLYTLFVATYVFACVVVAILLIIAFTKLIAQMLLVSAAAGGLYAVIRLCIKRFEKTQTEEINE